MSFKAVSIVKHGFIIFYNIFRVKHGMKVDVKCLAESRFLRDEGSRRLVNGILRPE